MKKYIDLLKMCISMFTIIPIVNLKWDNKKRNYMMFVLPIVGLIIGVLWFLFYYLLSFIKINNFIYLYAFFVSFFPMLISGFIHVDGFLDIVDALSSCENIDKKKKILKDPNVGSFAVIFFVFFTILNYLSIYSIISNHHFIYFLILIFIPFYSRFLSSISILYIKKINISEYKNVDIDINRKYFIILFLVVTFVLMFINIKFIFIVLFEILAYIIAMRICIKNFKGVNGDCSGFAIYVSESISLLAMAIIFNI